jgi:prephenate dehydratase
MTIRVGFQGEGGAFSEAAALELFGSVRTKGFTTFDELVEAVDSGAVDAGLIPCENTIYGSIARTYDLLTSYRRVKIVDETTYAIRQALIGMPDADVANLTSVASHPVALEQCRAFLAAHPGLLVRTVADTAGSVREMMERGDATAAAIGPARAAATYGAKVLIANVADDVENVTRFFAIARESAGGPSSLDSALRATLGMTEGRARGDKGRACVALDLPHEAGSLHAALGEMAARGSNLRSLVARPARDRAFHYRFFVEFDCADHATLSALERHFGGRMQLLGRY